MDGLPPLTRRAVLRGGLLAGVALLVPLGGAGPAVAVAVGTARFLTDAELRTLRAVVDRFVPGVPEDLDEGAVAAGCAEAIDALLGAFTTDPPRIYAGAPFSDRGGWPTNEFVDFLPLDPYEERAWRLRVEGSQGRAELERNGPVVGFQAVYREGLAGVDAQAGGDFAALPGPARDLVLRGSGDPAVQALVDVGFPHTLELLYGAPEYEGNRDLLAWEYTGFEGDVLPQGWTREQVENPEPGPALPLPVAAADVAALASFGTHEAGATVLMHGGGTASGTARAVQDLLAGASAAATEREAAAAAVRAVAAQIGSVQRGG